MAGFAYGVGQSWAPGGFLLPSPMPKDRAFEFWRGAGQFTAGAVELFSGLGLIGGGATAAGGGAVAALPTGGAGLLLTAGGAAVVTVGVAEVAQGASGIIAGIQTMIGSTSLSTGGGPGSSLSKGSTANLSKGTTLARRLREQLAIEQAMKDPGAGLELPRMKMTDPRWPAEQGWVKMAQRFDPGGGEIEVHYVMNRITGAVDDFKIVLSGVR